MEVSFMSRVLSLTLLLFLVPMTLGQEPLVKKVKASIAKAATFLVSKQQADGSWEDLGGDAKAAYHGGSTALVVLALLNCDGVLDEPILEQERKQCIQRGLARLRKLDSPQVYVRSLQTMALAEAKNPKDIPLINANVNWLLEARVYRAGKFIGWDYENRKETRASDASNSQYAILALWYARQAGIPIARDV